jgi:hypothetical protein
LINIYKTDSKQLVTAQIAYRNSDLVETYLATHPEIPDFLKQVWPSLEAYFGETIQLVLEVMTYPEEVGSNELVGWIQMTGDINEGLDKLEQFEAEWLEEQLRKVGANFNFNIEFR